MQSKEGVVVDRREMLRVKAKSLAEEARMIRREEKRSFGVLRNELHLHRVNTVRWEARATYIAYGLIRGTAYERIERPGSVEADWKKVRNMIEKYGPVNKDDKAKVLSHCLK